MDVVREHQHAALGEHDVVVQLLGEVLPEVEGVVVEPGALVVEVVRADDRGVAPGVAAAEPALVDHRDVGDPVLLRQVVGGAEAVAAGADDDHVVGGLRLRVRPLRRPVLLAGQRALDHLGEGEVRHAGLPKSLGPAIPDRRKSGLYRCVSIRCMLASEVPDGAAERRLHPGAAVHALRARRTSSTCCGSPPTRATGRGRSSAPGGCCRRRWSRSRRAAASSVQPEERLGDPARFDYLVVVGGLVDEIENLHPDTVRFLERAAAAGVPLVGVCTGTFALHRAGLMQGYRACVSWFHHEDFLERFDGLKPVSRPDLRRRPRPADLLGRGLLGASRGLHRQAAPRHGAGGEEPAHHDHRRGDGGGGAAAGHAAGARHRRRAGPQGAARHAAVDRRAALDRAGGGAARGQPAQARAALPRGARA